MQQNKNDKKNNMVNKPEIPRKKKKLSDEESAIHHIILSLFVIFATLNIMLQVPFTNMVDILDQTYTYPYEKNDLSGKEKDPNKDGNTPSKNSEGISDSQKSMIDPLDELVSNYQVTPHIKVGANEFSGVSKDTSNYVWQVLKLDDKLTSEIANKIRLYQNQEIQNSDEILTELDNLIEQYEKELETLDLPDTIGENSRSSLIFAQESLVKRHKDLKDAFEILIDDPKDTSNEVKQLIKDINSDKDEAASYLVNALRRSKKF